MAAEALLTHSPAHGGYVCALPQEEGFPGSATTDLTGEKSEPGSILRHGQPPPALEQPALPSVTRTRGQKLGQTAPSHGSQCFS